MTNESSLQSAEHIADRLVKGGAILGMLSLISIVVAVVFPIQAETQKVGVSQSKGVTIRLPAKKDVDTLLVMMAGRPLIRPPQIRAAVKDTGAAARLLKKLKLHGVIRMENELIAYIQISQERVKALRKGEKVLEFVVQTIEPGKVTLSLEGVEVTLGQ